jgi:hypothetical protein
MPGLVLIPSLPDQAWRETALFALVNFVPEAEGNFEEVTRVTCAGAASSWRTSPRRENFDAATGVVCKGRAVAANAVGRNGSGAQGWIGRLNRSGNGAGLLPSSAATWNCWRIDDFDARLKFLLLRLKSLTVLLPLPTLFPRCSLPPSL